MSFRILISDEMQYLLRSDILVVILLLSKRGLSFKVWIASTRSFSILEMLMMMTYIFRPLIIRYYIIMHLSF
jgi:hypothetical protein